jgi:cytochrome c oxidase subunit 2
MIANLYWLVFFMSVAVFIVVEGLLIYSIIRFRRRSDDELPVQVHGNTRLELAWTIGSGLIAAAVLIPSVPVLFATLQPPEDAVSAAASNVCFVSDIEGDDAAAFLGTSTLDIEVAGYQWWWEMNYPAYGITTAADMYVPVGAVVKLKMTSLDVAHSWWIPQLGGKQDVYPGAWTYTWFQATRPGVFEGHCTELCGVSHAYMPMRVVAVSQAEFEQWTQQQLAEAPEPTDELAMQGRDLFTEKGCVGCHSINGISSEARVGPNLTHLATRAQIGGILAFNEENLRTWLDDPLAVKPGVKMPDLGLSDEELDALAAYLATLE